MDFTNGRNPKWRFQQLLLLSVLATVAAVLPSGPKKVKPFDPNDDSSLISLYPAYTVLFPWFTQMIGVFLFFLLCKFEVPVPFAAIMFLVGAACGIGSTLRYEQDGSEELDQLSISVLQWSNTIARSCCWSFYRASFFAMPLKLTLIYFVSRFPNCCSWPFPWSWSGPP
jgi:hypothetical protein